MMDTYFSPKYLSNLICLSVSPDFTPEVFRNVFLNLKIIFGLTLKKKLKLSVQMPPVCFYSLCYCFRFAVPIYPKIISVM